MLKERKLILILGVLLAIISIVLRFITSGWLFMFGILSIIIFGIMHLVFLLDILKYYDKLLKSDKIIAWTGVLVFPIIFLFQFDFGDQPGNFYIYEYFTGNQTSPFKKYAFLIAIIAAFIYIINFIKYKLN